MNKDINLIQEPEENYKTGWIKIYRSIKCHWLWSNPLYLKAWIQILMDVNHKDSKILIEGELLECKKGQSLKSLNTWAKEFGNGWSIQKTRTFFDLLKKDAMIITEGLRKTTRLTICNYDIYQNHQQADNKQTTSRQQADNKQITINKNDKNDKNEENIYISFSHLKINIDDNGKLLELGYSQQMIDEIYDDIKNYSKNKNYTSLYLTARKWLKKSYPDIKPKEIKLYPVEESYFDKIKRGIL